MTILITIITVIVIGQPVEAVISSQNGRTWVLRAMQRSVAAALIRTPVPYNVMLPGMMVTGVIDTVVSNGITIQFLDNLYGTIDYFSLQRPCAQQDLKHMYTEGELIEARVIFVDPHSKSIRLSLKPHIIEWREPHNLPALGEIITDADVVLSINKMGVLCSRSPVDENGMDVDESDEDEDIEKGPDGDEQPRKKINKKARKQKEKKQREKDSKVLGILVPKNNLASIPYLDLDDSDDSDSDSGNDSGNESDASSNKEEEEKEESKSGSDSDDSSNSDSSDDESSDGDKEKEKSSKSSPSMRAPKDKSSRDSSSISTTKMVEKTLGSAEVIAPDRIDKMYKPYMPMGSVRVLGYHLVEGFASCSNLSTSLAATSILHSSQVIVGTSYKCTVQSVNDFGLVMNLGKNVQGVCPVLHLSDAATGGSDNSSSNVNAKAVKAALKQYKKGQIMDMRVWELKGSAIILTHKKTLLKLPAYDPLSSFQGNECAITSYTQLNKSVCCVGIISALNNTSGLVLSLFNKVKITIPMEILITQGVSDVVSDYRIGQLCSVVVLAIRQKQSVRKGLTGSGEALHKGTQGGKITVFGALNIGNAAKLVAVSDRWISGEEEEEDGDDCSEEHAELFKAYRELVVSSGVEIVTSRPASRSNSLVQDDLASDLNGTGVNMQESSAAGDSSIPLPVGGLPIVSGVVIRREENAYHVRLSDGRLGTLPITQCFDLSATSAILDMKGEDMVEGNKEDTPYLQAGQSVSDLMVISNIRGQLTLSQKNLLTYVNKHGLSPGTINHKESINSNSVDVPYFIPSHIKQLAKGQMVAGYVHKVENFGILVRFANAFTALIRKGDITDRFIASTTSGGLSEGDSIIVRVLSVDLDRERVLVTCKPSVMHPSKGVTSYLLAYLRESLIRSNSNTSALLATMKACNYELGQVVSAKVKSVGENEVLLSIRTGNGNKLNAICRGSEHTTPPHINGGKSPKKKSKKENEVLDGRTLVVLEGDKVNCRLLDIDAEYGCLTASLDEGLIADNTDDGNDKKEKEKTKKRSRSRSLSMNNLHVNQIVTARVEVVTDKYYIVSINEDVLAYCSLVEYHSPIPPANAAVAIHSYIKAVVCHVPSSLANSVEDMLFKERVFPYHALPIVSPFTQPSAVSTAMDRAGDDGIRKEVDKEKVYRQMKNYCLSNLRLDSVLTWFVSEITATSLKVVPQYVHYAEQQGIEDGNVSKFTINASVHVSLAIDKQSNVDRLEQSLQSFKNSDREDVSMIPEGHPFATLEVGDEIKAVVKQVRTITEDAGGNKNGKDASPSSKKDRKKSDTSVKLIHLAMVPNDNRKNTKRGNKMSSKSNKKARNDGDNDTDDSDSESSQDSDNDDSSDDEEVIDINTKSPPLVNWRGNGGVQCNQLHRTVVTRVDATGVTVSLSPYVSAFLNYLDISNNAKIVSNAKKYSFVGMPVTVGVVAINEDTNSKSPRLIVSRRLVENIATDTDSSLPSDLEALNQDAMQALKPGSITNGILDLKSCRSPAQPYVIVHLPGCVVGQVDFTEIMDRDCWADLSILSKATNSIPFSIGNTEKKGKDKGVLEHGAMVQCVVLSIQPWQLSLRPKRLSLAAISDNKKARKEAIGNDSILTDSEEAEDMMQGYVANVSSKGVFIRLSRHVTGQIEIRNLSDEFVDDIASRFKIGALVQPKLLSIKDKDGDMLDLAAAHNREATEKEGLAGLSIKLSLKDSSIDGSGSTAFVKICTERNIEVGKTVSGTVKSLDNKHGVFVAIDGPSNKKGKKGDSTVVGLARRINAISNQVSDLEEAYEIGSKVRAKVLQVNAASQKISLGLKASFFKADNEDSDDDDDDDDEQGSMEEDEESSSDSDDNDEDGHSSDSSGNSEDDEDESNSDSEVMSQGEDEESNEEEEEDGDGGNFVQMLDDDNSDMSEDDSELQDLLSSHALKESADSDEDDDDEEDGNMVNMLDSDADSDDDASLQALIQANRAQDIDSMDESEEDNESDSDSDSGPIKQSNKTEKGKDKSNGDSEDSEDSEEDSEDDSDGDIHKASMFDSNNVPAVDANALIQWDDFKPTTSTSSKGMMDSDDSDDEDDSDDSGDEKEASKGKKARSKTALRRRAEADIRSKEDRYADGDFKPESSSDYERLLLAEPNSSFLWIQYMSFCIGNADIDAARAVCKRALKQISYRMEDEKYNIWVAFVNLEYQYGDASSLQGIFDQGVKESKGKYLYLHLCQQYASNGDNEGCTALYEKALKKYKYSKKVWMAYQHWTLKSGNISAAKKLLARSMQSLSKHKHIEVMSKYALKEFEIGSADRARVLFEELISNYPKKTDLMHIYVDKEVKCGHIEQARNLFERMISSKHNVKNMRAIFKKYLEFEKSEGTEATVESVLTKAKEYTASLA